MYTSSVDNQHPTTVNQFLAQVVPDRSVRQLCCHILATSIMQAHEHNRRSWGTTLFPNGETAIRLTVGLIYVCNLHPGGITLTLYAPAQAIEPLRPFLEAQNIAGLEQIQSQTPLAIPTAPRFPSLPEAVWCWFRYEDLVRIWPLVEVAYTKTIGFSARKRVNPSVGKTHAESILAYLRNNGYPDLPQPDHTKQERSSKGRHRFLVSNPTIITVVKDLERQNGSLYEEQ